MYDRKCHDLADAFMTDADFAQLTPLQRTRHTARLAQEIQNAVEAFTNHDDQLQIDMAQHSERTTHGKAHAG